MHKSVARGLAVAALTGGFTFLGATAANAIDIGDGILDDDGGLLGTGLLADDTTTTTGGIPVDVTLPVDVSGVDVSVLDGALNGTQLGGLLGSDHGSGVGTGVIGDGIIVTADQATADLFAVVDSGQNDVLHGIVGVPVDLSGTWASVLGNPETGGENGVVLVPELTADPFAATDGILDSFIYAPINVSCVTVSVLSDYLGQECNVGSTPGSPANGGSGGVLELSELLGGDILGDGVLDLDDLLEIDGILDGDILGDGVLDLDEVLELDGLLGGDLLGGDLGLGDDVVETDLLHEGVLAEDVISTDDGVLVDPFEAASETAVVVDAVDAVVGVPLDLSGTWASVFGPNGGIVIVPDLATTPAAFFGDDLIAQLPISIDCASIVILSDYERDCAAGPVDPTDPTDPTDPVDPTGPVVPTTPVDPMVSDEFNTGGADNGGTGGTEGENGAGDPCIAIDNTAAVDEGFDLGVIGVAALAGALAAMVMMALMRRFSAVK